MNDFKERIRLLRKEKGMTQSELANILNYGYTAISNYESGRNEPSIEDIIKIATFFQVSIDYLVGKTDIRECLCLTELAAKYKEKINNINNFVEEMRQALENFSQKNLQ